MTATIKLIAVASGIALMSVSSAFAEGVEVGGNLTNVTVVKQATNLALGAHSTAKQSLGSIGGNVEVGGNIRNITVIGKAVNLAVGISTEAEMSVGSIRDLDTPSGIKQTIVVRNVVNVAIGGGTKSCVSVGYGTRC